MIEKPLPEEYAPFYETYVSKVPVGDVVEFLKKQVRDTIEFLESIPEGKKEFAYGPGKWTIAQVLQHINDTERLFSFRLFCIGRGEKQALPGFDQDEYLDAANISHKSLSDLISEFQTLRKSTFDTIDGITEEGIMNIGVASGVSVSARALISIIGGHVAHHVGIIKERYL